ncbi:hypothetical protein GGR57DRAFT_95393 [Xylariaceae sp. FL1272]|nr:hypothetical protein GGR57DRAFT_95393 [Xylariaceae sp. FL1272]
MKLVIIFNLALGCLSAMVPIPAEKHSSLQSDLTMLGKIQYPLLPRNDSKDHPKIKYCNKDRCLHCLNLCQGALFGYEWCKWGQCIAYMKRARGSNFSKGQLSQKGSFSGVV